MNILIVSQHYYPEPFRITAISEDLVKRGHSVTVLCGIPNYPEGFYYPGYSIEGPSYQLINGVRVIRAKEKERKKDVIHRVINYYSFSWSANRIAKNIKEKFDAIFVNELSPIMACTPAIKYKKRHNVPILMYEMDLWPESLLEGGISRRGLIYKYYSVVSKRIYEQMDKILVSSPSHSDRISKLIGHTVDIQWLPQYSDDPEINRKPHEQNKPFGFIFAGNLGKSQSVITILKAAALLLCRKDILFFIVGYGSEYENLQKYRNKCHLTNTIFLGRLSSDEVAKQFEKMDAALLTLTKGSVGEITIPGKTQSYLKAGLPIICAAGKATESFLSQTGSALFSAPEDAEALAKNIVHFVSLSDKEKKKMSDKAKLYFSEHLTKSSYMSRIEKELLLLCQRNKR